MRSYSLTNQAYAACSSTTCGQLYCVSYSDTSNMSPAADFKPAGDGPTRRRCSNRRRRILPRARGTRGSIPSVTASFFFAKFGPAPAGGRGRGQVLPGSFTLMVVEHEPARR